MLVELVWIVVLKVFLDKLKLEVGIILFLGLGCCSR